MPILTKETMKHTLPDMVSVYQKFEYKQVANVEAEVRNEIKRLKDRIEPGARVAVAVGSRGIENLQAIVSTLCEELIQYGCSPFVVPAMGSHGGGTALGQEKVLSEYGITEKGIHVPVESSMEVVEIGETECGVPVYMDKIAYDADATILVARVKPHTDFRGPYESGLCKMMAIGLGKHIGCSRLHQEGFDRFAELIPNVGKVFLENANIAFALAIVENAYHGTALIEGVLPEEIMNREPFLLEEAKRLMPEICLAEIDVLIVEEIGKDITGAGMDPNITGRTSRGLLDGYQGPKIGRIVVLGLTEATHGNAAGIGIADFITQNCYDSICFEDTYANVIASGNCGAGKIPVVMPDERQAVLAALQCCPGVDVRNARIVRIKNTLSLNKIFVSENLQEEFLDLK